MNKTFTLLTLALCVVSFTASAQLTIGPKAGADFCILSTSYENSNDKPDDYEPVNGIGFHVGAFFNIGTDGYFSLQPEVYYGMRNISSDESSVFDDGLGTVVTTEVEGPNSFGYLTIPLLAMLSPNESFTLYAGPQMSFLMGANREYSGSITTSVQGQDDVVLTVSESYSGIEAVEDSYSSAFAFSGTEFGVCIGFQVNVDPGVSAGLRLNRGLTPLNAEFQNISKDNWTILQFVASYTLGGGGE